MIEEDISLALCNLYPPLKITLLFSTITQQQSIQKYAL